MYYITSTQLPTSLSGVNNSTLWFIWARVPRLIMHGALPPYAFLLYVLDAFTNTTSHVFLMFINVIQSRGKMIFNYGLRRM
jgi:hypothetical protein